MNVPPRVLSFALCPSCERMRAVVRRGPQGSYRTRRHGACGVVVLPPLTPARPL